MGLGLWFSHVATDIDLMWQHGREQMHLVYCSRFTNQFTITCCMCEFCTVTEDRNGALDRNTEVWNYYETHPACAPSTRAATCAGVRASIMDGCKLAKSYMEERE